MNNALSLLSRTRLSIFAFIFLCASFLLQAQAPPPVITSISPTSGPVGTVVTIHGFNFGTQQGDVYFDYDGVTITPSSWGDTTIVATIPAGMYGSTPFDVARPDGGWSNYSQVFEVTSAPDFSPIESPIVPHGYLTLTGYIGKRGPNTRIRINDNDVPILMWNEQYAQVKLPDTIGPGTINVKIRNEYGETSRDYSVALASGIRIQFDPSFQNFGTVTVGQSANATISIANVGSQDASITSTTIEGSSEFTQSNGCGTQIYAGQSCSATVTFTPQATGPRSGYLVVTGATGTWRLPLVGSVPSTGVLAANMKIAGAADLSVGQKLDWVHWGYQSLDGVRKAGVIPLITYSVIGTGTPTSDSYDGQIALKWSDGAAPNTSGSGSSSTLEFPGYAAQNGSGYRIVVPADTSTRTLKLYAGAYQGRVEVRAYLSDGSAAPYVDGATLNSGDAGWAARVIQLDYRAQSANQNLTVELVMVDRIGNYNNVILQAATLEMAQPSVALTSPVDHSVINGLPATITLQATASQYDSAIAKVEFYKNGTKIGEAASSPYSLQPSITSGGDYVFVARAIDQNNLFSDSAPVAVHVVGTGGTLTGSAANSGGPTAIDLSAGSSDWIHWGYDSVTSVNRKSSITPQIGNFTVIGDGIPRWPYTWNTMFSWTGGTPTDSVPYSLGAIYARGPGQGFHLSVPAGTAQKTLKLYLGLWSGEGTLRATLSDGSAAPYVVTDTDTQLYDEKVYSITFKAASPGQTLNIDYYVSGSLPYTGVYLESTTLTVDDAVTFSPGSYDFGNVALGASPTQAFILTNNDTAARPVSLTTNGSFTQSNTCPASLAVGASCSVTVAFTPPTTGQLTGGVTATSGTYVRSAVLFGTGVLPPAPVISNIAANPATRGSIVTVSGTNFGIGGQQGVLSLNGIQVPTTSWNATAITFIVPANAVTGPLVVSNYGASSSQVTLNVTITGVLRGKTKIAPGFINLTTDNALDWMHWGTSASELSTHKTGANLLPNLTVLGSDTPQSFSDSEIAYSWADGIASPSATNSTTGIYLPGVGNGYRLVLLASTTPQTVRLYLGTYRGTAQLTATLSDNSAPAFSDTSLSSSIVANGVYELTFRSATDGQTLTIDYTLAADLGDVSSPGNVTLQSAELFPALPEVSITAPASDSVFVQNNAMDLAATATQIDRPISTVAFNEGSAEVITLNSQPYQVTVNNAIAGLHVYSASASDTSSVVTTSEPVRVHVNAGGGTLTGSYGDKPAAIDLSQGTSDWVHWGNGSETRIDRKRCVTPQISNFTALKNKVYWYDNGITNYSWSGGRPADSVADSYTGVYALDAGSGYRFTVAAGTDVRTLKFYVEADATAARVTATLSDGSAAPYVFTYSPADYDTKEFTIQFAAASANQTLTVEFESVAGHGYVSLEAATVTLATSIATATCPTISVVIPNSALPGDTVTISGSGFSVPGIVYFGGQPISYSSWNDSTVQFIVPGSSPSGEVSLETNGIKSNDITLTVNSPFLQSISPNHGGYGATITITGVNFGTRTSDAAVFLNSTALPIASWTSSQIKVTLPRYPYSGEISVVRLGLSSNPKHFEVMLGERYVAQSVYVSPDEMSIAAGETRSLKLVGANGTEITDATWTVDAPDLAEVQQAESATGGFVIKGKFPGKAVITGHSSFGEADAVVNVYSLLSLPPTITRSVLYPETVYQRFVSSTGAVRKDGKSAASFLTEELGTDNYEGFAVIALDAAKHVLWRKEYRDADETGYPPYTTAAIGTEDGGVLLHNGRGDGSTDWLLKLDASGNQQWIYSPGVSLHRPAVSNKAAYARSYDGSLKILSMLNGTETASIEPPSSHDSWDLTNEYAPGGDTAALCKDQPIQYPPIGNSSGFLTDPIIGADGEAYLLVASHDATMQVHNCSYYVDDRNYIVGHPETLHFVMISADGNVSATSTFGLMRVTDTGSATTTPIDTTVFASSVTWSGVVPHYSSGDFYSGTGGLVVPDGKHGALISWQKADQRTHTSIGDYLSRIVGTGVSYTNPQPAQGNNSTFQLVADLKGNGYFNRGGNLTSFDVETGQPQWNTSIGQIVASTESGVITSSNPYEPPFEDKLFRNSISSTLTAYGTDGEQQSTSATTSSEPEITSAGTFIVPTFGTNIAEVVVPSLDAALSGGFDVPKAGSPSKEKSLPKPQIVSFFPTTINQAGSFDIGHVEEISDAQNAKQRFYSRLPEDAFPSVENFMDEIAGTQDALGFIGHGAEINFDKADSKKFSVGLMLGYKTYLGDPHLPYLISDGHFPNEFLRAILKNPEALTGLNSKWTPFLQPFNGDPAENVYIFPRASMPLVKNQISPNARIIFIGSCAYGKSSEFYEPGEDTPFRQLWKLGQVFDGVEKPVKALIVSKAINTNLVLAAKMWLRIQRELLNGALVGDAVDTANADLLNDIDNPDHQQYEVIGDRTQKLK